jgi:hypothetical protein
MVAPYERGQEIASLHDDPEGMRVVRDRVEEIIEDGPDSYLVTTSLARGVVDAEGVGSNLAPIDHHLEEMFTERGDEFVVLPTWGVVTSDQWISMRPRLVREPAEYIRPDRDATDLPDLSSLASEPLKEELERDDLDRPRVDRDDDQRDQRRGGLER